MGNNDAVVVLLGIIATINLVVGTWMIHMSLVYDRHLVELRISLNELHLRWIDEFGEQEVSDDV